MIWNKPFGVNWPGYVPSQLLMHLQPPSWQGGVEAEKSLTQYKYCFATPETSVWLLPLVSISPNLSAIPATSKKTNSIPLETRTEPKLLMKICATSGFHDSGQQI